jgi:hypothetical protein
VLDGVVDEGIWSTCNESIRVCQSGRNHLIHAYVNEWQTSRKAAFCFLVLVVDMYNNQNYYQQQGSSSDVNPYHQPYQGPIYPLPSTSSSHNAPVPANAYEYDVGILAQQSVYVPGAMIDKKGGSGGKLAKGGKRTTVLRKGAGKTWEDQTLLEWNPCTLFVISSFSESLKQVFP